MDVNLVTLPGGWRWEPLANLCECISVGYVSSTRAFFCARGEGVPLVRSQNIRPGRLVLDNIAWVTRAFHDANPKSQLHPGDVLITRVGANAGDVCIVPDSVGELHLSSAVFARPLSEHRKYIELFFRSPLGQNLLKARIVGSVSERINTRDVESLSILLPTSKEEAAITNILGTLDDKIALNRRMNGTLEVTVGTIFKQWFVDFEFPNEEGKPYKSAGGEMTYNEELREEIPNGWEPGHLGDVADNPRRGIQPETVEEGTPYIGLEHMPRRSIALSEWGTTEEVTSHKFKFQQGEILFGKLRPYFHKVGVATVSGVCSTDILIVVPKSVEWYSLVLSHVSSDRFVSFVDAASTGTRMPRTNWENMARYQLLIPTYNVVQKFNDGIVPLLGKIRANILQSRTLITTRDLLLPKLLSGKIVPS